MKKFFYKNFNQYNLKCEKLVNKMCYVYHKSILGKYRAWFLYLKLRKKYNIDISPAAQINNLKIPHSVGIVIGTSSIIGENTKVLQNVTIGAKYSEGTEHATKGAKRHPTIGANCLICAGAVVLGPITIGDNVIIGANAIVTKDVPSNCVVVGVNKIIKTETNFDENK